MTEQKVEYIEDTDTYQDGESAIVGPDDEGNMHVLTFPLAEEDKKKWGVVHLPPKKDSSL